MSHYSEQDENEDDHPEKEVRFELDEDSDEEGGGENQKEEKQDGPKSERIPVKPNNDQSQKDIVAATLSAWN